MKINATFSRSSKKDYYDLYELLNVFTFANLIEFHKTMYPNYALAGILKSLADFHEVEQDSEPIIILKEVDWITIKELISENIKDYVASLQQKKSDVENERQKSIEQIISNKKRYKN